MSQWKCSVAASAMGDARASLGALAEEVVRVEATSDQEALEKAKAEIMERSPLTSTLPVDLLDDWLIAEPNGGA
ncbi:hypothetical protein HC341_11405 [Aquisalimonas sp. 2447]|uniref:hypothetical protein n=1 Tax=Aquisalimonas sp. 2447 TaxID=2740807 RepID=UPI001432334E|nr:hypothetical protein [Aquisalimonas sp. 2447]QIT55763.1 hypothetical protein HC341_11405 [Aquisalimonas sp. 2447]